jgi:hypothetical protein
MGLYILVSNEMRSCEVKRTKQERSNNMDFIQLIADSSKLNDYILEKTKDCDPASFLATIGSCVDRYARKHDISAIALHELLYKTACEIHSETTESKEAN